MAATDPRRQTHRLRGGCSERVAVDNVGRWPRRIVNWSQSIQSRTQDLATPAVSPPTTTNITDLVAPSASGLLTTDITNTTLLTTGSPVAIGSQVLDVSGVLVPNAATSGAVAQAPTTAAISSVAMIGSQGEVIATSGGSSLPGGGASGRTLPECITSGTRLHI